MDTKDVDAAINHSLIMCDVPAGESLSMGEMERMNGVAIATVAHMLRLAKMVGLETGDQLFKVLNGITNVTIAGLAQGDEGRAKMGYEAAANAMAHNAECENCLKLRTEHGNKAFNAAAALVRQGLQGETVSSVPAGTMVH